MTLSEYLEVNKKSYAAFGKEAGKPGSTVRRWALQQRIPGKDDMKLVHDLTEGAVTPNDFYGIPQDYK